MKIHVLSLFPDMFTGVFGSSILKKAQEKQAVELTVTDIREFSENKHKQVDDYPYGGGAGMVMQPGPVYSAYESIKEKAKGARVVYMTPQGKVFNQKMAEELAQEENLIFLCGHYEGIDERVLEEIVTDEVSIGDYVLTGGELPALVMMDAIGRLVPGVLNNDVSAEIESFHDNLLEYPQYTRPVTWHEKEVPSVLLSGHHGNVEKWRREKSIERTLAKRPDLLKDANLDKKEQQYLAKLKEANK